MPSSVTLRSVVLVRTDVSVRRIASIIRVRRIGELGTLATEARWKKNTDEGGDRCALMVDGSSNRTLHDADP
jgi:hypothetical protein